MNSARGREVMTDSVARVDRPIDTARLLRTLERCADMRPCCGDKFMGCEYRAIHGSDGCYRHLAHDVLALLNAQEPVVRCAGCRYCVDADRDTPYDGDEEWYCKRWERYVSAYSIDPYRFYCAAGERRDKE